MVTRSQLPSPPIGISSRNLQAPSAAAWHNNATANKNPSRAFTHTSGVRVCFFDSVLPSDLWLARRALQLAKRLPAQSVTPKSLDLHCQRAKRQRLSRVPEKKPAKEKTEQALLMAKLGSRPAISSARALTHCRLSCSYGRKGSIMQTLRRKKSQRAIP